MYRFIIKYVIAAIAVISIIVFIWNGFFYTISPGYRGVKVTLSKVEEISLPNGIGIKWPFISKVIEMNVQTQVVSKYAETYTADLQTAKIDYTFIYELKPHNVHKLYEEVGENYREKEIIPVLNGVLKDAVGKWTALDLVTNRDQARIEVIALLNERINTNFFQNISFDTSRCIGRCFASLVYIRYDCKTRL